MTDIWFIINEIFIDNIGDEFREKINLDSNLLELNIDSIMFIKIIVSIEEAFHFEFDDEMLLFSAFPKVKSIVKYVESKI